jgi:peptide/nickel transport system substrate-binding protein
MIDLDWLGDMTLQPRLAQSWRRIDERTLELALRPGVKFHNGDPVTPEDVVFSFGPEHMWGPGGNAANSAPATAPVLGSSTAGAGTKQPAPEVLAISRMAFPGFERMQIVDAHTVRFINAVPDVTLEGRLARPAGSIVSQRAFNAAPDWLSWARAPVGTGPYRIVSYQPEQELVLAAFDEYWGGRPPLAGVRFVQVPETASRIDGLLSGQYDFACDIPPDQIAEVQRSPRHEVVGGLIANHRVTAFDATHPQLRDPRVRRAMSQSVDRQAIVDSLWAGKTKVPKGMQWEFFGKMFLADWDVPRFDPDEAKRLLREAGYRGDLIPYPLLPNYYNGQVSTAQVLVDNWKNVGLNVQITMRENWSRVMAPGAGRGVRDNSQTCFFNDPVGAMASFGPSGQQWASGEWRNDEAARMLNELQSATDLDRRRKAFRRMLEICEREDPAYSILHQTVNLTAKRKDAPWRTGQSFAMDFSPRNWGAARG